MVRIHIVAPLLLLLIVSSIWVKSPVFVLEFLKHIVAVGMLQTIVLKSLIAHLHPLDCVNAGVLLGERSPRLLKTDVQVRTAIVTTLGGDENNTVGTSHTENGSSRSVFQHTHVFNLVRVQLANHVTLHTIDQNQRVLVDVRTDTTQEHCCAIDTWLTTTVLE